MKPTTLAVKETDIIKMHGIAERLINPSGEYSRDMAEFHANIIELMIKNAHELKDILRNIYEPLNQPMTFATELKVEAEP